MTLIRSCGHCHDCTQGNLVQCDTKFAQYEKGPLTTKDGKPITHGLNTGAFAEYAVVDASQAVAIPRTSPSRAPPSWPAASSPASAPWSTRPRSRPAPMSWWSGTGGVGLNCIQGASLRGARSVIAVDLSDEKLAAAKRFGATHGVNPARATPPSRSARSPAGAAPTTSSSPSAPSPPSSRPSAIWAGRHPGGGRHARQRREDRVRADQFRLPRPARAG